MIKPRDPRELAIDLLPRSTCKVKVAAVIADRHGIFSWGWNSSGPDGLGEHAEAAAIRRSSKKRLRGSTIYVAGAWKHSEKVVTACPCMDCAKLIRKHGLNVGYRRWSGEWS